MHEPPGRQALLRATITVVARSGLRQMTYRAVAAEAGVSHSLVRHHFGSRDALIAAALEYAVDRSLADTMAEPHAPSDFAQGLETLASADRDMQAFQYELLIESTRRPELRPAVAAYYETYRDMIARRLRTLGVDDPELADVVWFALDGLVFKQTVVGDVPEAERVLARIRRLLEVADGGVATS